MNLKELSKVKTTCAYVDDWRNPSTRCTKTSEDGLPYSYPWGGFLCKEHGSQDDRAIKCQSIPVQP